MDNCLLIKPKYELWTTSAGYRIYCFDHRLANKLNKVLNAYPDYSFVEGEEAQFKAVQACHLSLLGLSPSYISSLPQSPLLAVSALHSKNGEGGMCG